MPSDKIMETARSGETVAGTRPSRPDYNSEEFQTQFRIEQSVHLVGQQPTLIIGNTLGALIGFLLTVDFLPLWQAALWGVIPLLTVPMFLNWLKLRHKPRPSRVSGRRIRMTTYHSGFMGIVWVVVVFLALPKVPTLNQVGLIFGIIVLCTGAVASISALPNAVMAYFMPMMALAFIATTRHGTMNYQPVAVLSGLMFIALFGFLRSNVATFRRNVMMIVEQARLVEQQKAEVERRTAAELEVRATHQRLQSIIAALPVPVAIFDTYDGRVIYANKWAAQMLGVTVADLVKSKGVDFLPANTDEARQIRQLQLGEALSDLEVEIKRFDGTRFWVRLSCIAMEYEGEESLLVALEDITDRRMREQHLRDARQAAEEASLTKSAFLANMSHELRTPLNAIIGYSEMLLEDAIDRNDTANQSDLEKIQTAGRHLLGLISDILDLSKIEAGRMQLYLEEVDLAAVVTEVCMLVEPLAAKNGNKIAPHCAPGIGSMVTDITKLKQNLVNLLSNAAKFTNGGTITLAVDREKGDAGGQTVFRVSDTGIGMTKDQMARLFQAFTQADSSTTRHYGGTGLGLTITKHFCMLLGGTIEVDSEPGKGTTFTMVLPDQPQAAADDAVAAAASVQ